MNELIDVDIEGEVDGDRADKIGDVLKVDARDVEWGKDTIVCIVVLYRIHVSLSHVIAGMSMLFEILCEKEGPCDNVCKGLFLFDVCSDDVSCDGVDGDDVCIEGKSLS
jgi:hypothetical protein